MPYSVMTLVRVNIYVLNILGSILYFLCCAVYDHEIPGAGTGLVAL